MSLKSVLVILCLSVSALAIQAQTSAPNSSIKQTNTIAFENVAVGDFSKDGDRLDGVFDKDNRIAVNLAEGEHDANNDFIQEKVGKISGSVMEDTNNDNEGDKAIAGVVIRLFDKSGKPALDKYGSEVPFQITNIYGFYQFDNLREGEYIIIKGEAPINNTQVSKPQTKQTKTISNPNTPVSNTNTNVPNKQVDVAKKPLSQTKDVATKMPVNEPVKTVQKTDTSSDYAKSTGVSFQDIVDNKDTSKPAGGTIGKTVDKKTVEPTKADVPVFEKPVQKHVLLVGSSIDEASQAFLPFKMNFGNYLYENYDYASHAKLGTGYDVNLNLPDLLDYEMIFLKMDMGSFSEDMINSLAEYIEIGGKIYIIFDAHDRAYYLDKMEANVNLLLKKVAISDQVKFSHEIVNNQNKSGVVHTISNTVRRKNNKKSIAEKIGLSSGKKNDPVVRKSFLTTMGKGHYIKPVSDLSEAHTICRFEVDQSKFITNVFWKAGHGGAIGIGTEKQTSAYPEFGSLDAWKILAEGLDLK